MSTGSLSLAGLYEEGAAERDRDTPTERPYRRVAHALEAQIRDGHLRGGQKLPTERELGAFFGVSRAVVREAVKVLDTLGLVHARQGSGIYVRAHPVPLVSHALTLSVAPERAGIRNLFEFRATLESTAAAFAAARHTEPQRERLLALAAASATAAASDDTTAFGDADRQFHALIGEASGNPYFAVMINALYPMQRTVMQLVTHLRGSLTIAAGHHLRLAEAIAARDAGEAAAVMQAHIGYTASLHHDDAG